MSTWICYAPLQGCVDCTDGSRHCFIQDGWGKAAAALGARKGDTLMLRRASVEDDSM